MAKAAGLTRGPLAVPVLRAVATRDRELELRFDSENGVIHELERSADLSASSWSVFGDPSFGTGEELMIRLPLEPEFVSRFFRLHLR